MAVRKLLRPFEVVIAWTACAIFGHRVQVQGIHFTVADVDLPEGAPVVVWPGRVRTLPCLRCGRKVQP